ncbi:MAG: hypothetical protein WCF23_03680 [Candidatus Nitrosopolaris sp.]
MISTFAIVVIGSTMTAAATTVQAHTTANGFSDGFAKTKLDLANNQTSSYTTHGIYCQQFMSGYETEWIQAHWYTSLPTILK